jgi:hypothetical protein
MQTLTPALPPGVDTVAQAQLQGGVKKGDAVRNSVQNQTGAMREGMAKNELKEVSLTKPDETVADQQRLRSLPEINKPREIPRREDEIAAGTNQLRLGVYRGVVDGEVINLQFVAEKQAVYIKRTQFQVATQTANRNYTSSTFSYLVYPYAPAGYEVGNGGVAIGFLENRGGKAVLCGYRFHPNADGSSLIIDKKWVDGVESNMNCTLIHSDIPLNYLVNQILFSSSLLP